MSSKLGRSMMVAARAVKEPLLMRKVLGAGLLLGWGAIAWAANVDVQVATFTDSPDPAVRGGQITYTTVVKNGGPAIATNVVVTWPVPANTTFVSVNDGTGGGTCSHNGATPGVVTCNYASVPVDLTSADWKTISLMIQTGASTPSTINASASTTQTDNTDTSPSNDSLTQNTTINSGADLSFAISGAPNPAQGAGNVTWTITGSNLGPDTSGPITVTVPLPGVLTYQSASGTGWSCSHSSPNVTCTRAALTSGSAYSSLSIATKISAQVSSGTLTVGGSIGQTIVGDPVSANNSATASVTVNPGLDLAITQDVASPSSANAGGTAMTFVLRPSNLGPYDASTGANVTFPLPTGFTLTSATGTNGWTCLSAGSPITVTCSLNSNLASGAGSVLTIVTGTPATVAGSTVYTLTGTVAVNGGGPTDPIAGNNTAARSVTVVPVGLDLSLTKTKTPAFVALNANMTTRIVVASATGGVSAAAGTITVTDVLNTAFETYVSASGNWTCSASTLPAPTQTVTCTYNAVLNGGASASTLTLTTLAMVEGVATNNASVAYSGTPGDYNAANDGPISASLTVTATLNSPDLVAGLTVTTPGGVATTLEANEDTVSYVATLTNSNATAADAVNTRMTLTIPARTTGTAMSAIGIVVTNTSGSSTATYTCSPVTGILATSTITCTQGGGILKPGDFVTFTVPISRPLLNGTFTNPPNVSVTSTTQGDPTPANNTATATVVIAPVADIQLVSKQITSANPARAGTDVTYVVTIRNNGPSSAAGVSMVDVFAIPGGDTGFTFISAVASNSGTCSGLTANTVYTGTPTLNCNWAASVANGATRTVTIIVRPNWMSGDPERIWNNTATVSTTTTENPAGGDNGNNSQTATLTINAAQVDALINNTDTPDPLGYDPIAAANNDVTYDVAVTNNGPSLVSGLGFTYTMTPPAGKTVIFRGDGSAASVASTTASGTIAGSICNNVGGSVTGPATLTLTCTFAAPGQLANTSTIHRYLVFRVGTAPATSGDTYTTNSTVITNETDSNSANNSEGETTTVRQRVDLSITKTPSINPVQLRQPFDWTITLTNNGPGNSDTTTLTDTLPAGMTLFGATPSFITTGVVKSGNCSVAGQALTCNISAGSANPFNSGEVATVTVPVRMTAYPSGGTSQNCTSAVTDQVDPAAGNNTAVCSTLTVQRSSIAGRVFNDPNRDGLFAYAGTEAGINVASIVALSGTDVYGNPVSLTRSTAGTGASAGAFSFNDLSPADASGYTITETQPATHVNGPTDPPTPTLPVSPAGDQGTYSRGGLAGNSAYSAIKLAANQAGTNYNFPEVRRPTLSGTVYVDVNTNNVYDSGIDTHIQGATLILRNTADLTNSVATTTTLANGTYSFSNLDPLITYVLEEPLPSSPAGLGNRVTAVNVGTVGGAAIGTAAANSPSADIDRITGIDLSQGVDGINYHFGEDQTTSISGTVFNDHSRDGIQNGTEPGIGSVSLKLVAGTDCTAAAFVSTGLTNPVSTAPTTGAYSFAPVPAGAQYTICETQPSGYADGPVGLATSAAIASLSTAGSTGNNFPEVLGSIGGTVFVDFGSGVLANNNNGTQQGSEPGLGSATANAGVPVTLTGTPSVGPALPVGGVTVYTDASGNYSYADLYPGTYVVTQAAVPVALGVYNDGINTAGAVSSAGTPGTAGAVGHNTISNLVMAAGSQSQGNNFAKMPVAPITGTVYIDLNRNNLMEAEPTDGRIAGATLKIYNAASCTGPVVATLSTEANGNYLFSGASAGQAYTICETQPSGYDDGAVNPGTDATTATANVITISTLAASGSANNDFGELQGNATISGVVYVDANDDGLKDVAEPGIANVVLTLTGNDSANTAHTRSTTTDSNGLFSFGALPGSDGAGYTVTETQPTGYLDGKETRGTVGGVATGSADTGVYDTDQANNLISGIVLLAGQSGINYLFGERGGRLNGFVYVDANNSGTKDVGEAAIPGIEVMLTGTTTAGPDIATIRNCVATPDNCKSITDASGAFSFDGVAPGTYTLVENQTQVGLIADASGAPKYVDGMDTAGVAGGTVNNAYFGSQSIYNTIGAIQITSGLIASNAGNIGGYLFGEGLRAGTTGLALMSPIVSGYVYFDTTHSRTRGAAVADTRVEGWTITLTATKSTGATEVICKVMSDATGFYHIDNVACAPGYPLWSNGLPTTGTVAVGGGTYQTFTLAFTNPGVHGMATEPQSGGSAGTIDPVSGQIAALTLNPGDDIVEQNLPLDPSGVIYDSVTRAPIAGAVVEILGPGGVPVPSACLLSGQNTVTTGANGYYEFLLVNPVAFGCPGTGTYSLRVTQPAGYIPAPSSMIPACAGSISVVAGLAVVQTSNLAPAVGTPLAAASLGACPATSATLAAGAGSTQYFFSFGIDFSAPSGNFVNNHIPLDPVLVGTIHMSKTSPMVNVARGDLVPYTVTATNTMTGVIGNVNVLDRIPPGFRYRLGSATLNGVASEPTVGGRDLTWAGQTFAAAQTKIWKMILVVGAGVGEGEYVNQTWSLNNLIDSTISNVATATVRVIPDPTFDCSDLIGKVFDDQNANGYQDEGEPGIANVRVVTARGLLVTTDHEGRFHVACAAIPQMDHGSNFIMKLDERSLPSGYRLTTENPRDVRVTRGKMVKLNFGATVHRVVRLEISAAAFVGATTELAPQWTGKFATLPAKLKERPSVLRIAYRRGAEAEDLARARLDAVAVRAKELWQAARRNEKGDDEPRQPLLVETEMIGAK